MIATQTSKGNDPLFCGGGHIRLTMMDDRRHRVLWLGQQEKGSNDSDRKKIVGYIKSF